MVQANNLSTLVAETGETDVENHPQLYIDFVIVLSNKILWSKKKMLVALLHGFGPLSFFSE